jgi:hypothetical protein
LNYQKALSERVEASQFTAGKECRPEITLRILAQSARPVARFSLEKRLQPSFSEHQEAVPGPLNQIQATVLLRPERRFGEMQRFCKDFER